MATSYTQLMTEGAEGFSYRYDPTPAGPLLEEGVTRAWYVIHSGKPGPATAVEVAALVDAEGNVFIEQTGEWEPVTVTDD